MKSVNIKHSVLIISYFQEDYIGTTIESVLNQTELPYEIIISDDCSKDDTWNIIQRYQKKHPDLIRAYRNDPNIGIFQNLEKVLTYASGNVINRLSGDDLYKPETLEQISNAITGHNLDPDVDKFIVALNSLHLYPDGRETLWNNFQEKEWDPVKLRLRYGLSYRSIGLSKPLINVVPTERMLNETYPEMSYGVDWIKGFEEVIQAEKIIFVDYAGPVYRLGVGVTSRQKREESIRSHLLLIKYLKERYKKYWDQKDLKYFEYLEITDTYQLDPSMKGYLAALYHWIRNYNNFSSNYPWIREGKTFLPSFIYPFLKYQVYPAVQYLRGRMSK